MLGKPKVTQAMAKAVCCFMQTDSKDLFLKTTPTSLIEHEGVELVPNWILHLTDCTLPGQKESRGAWSRSTKQMTSYSIEGVG